MIFNLSERYVPSEGAAGLVLKTKNAALRDGDKILGVVRATITKHDGRSQGLVAPNVRPKLACRSSSLKRPVSLLLKSSKHLSFYVRIHVNLTIILFLSSFMEAHGTGKHEMILRYLSC